MQNECKWKGTHLIQKIVCFIPAMIASLPTLAGAANHIPNRDIAEAQVIRAALVAAIGPRIRGYVLVPRVSASFDCSRPAADGFSWTASCSPMSAETASPEKTLDDIQDGLGPLSMEMRKNFLEANRKPRKFPVPLTAPFAVHQWSPGDSDASLNAKGNPEYAVYLSRVGFSDDMRSALLYIGKINWTDQSKSSGDYMLLKKEPRRWVVVSTRRYWALID